MLPCARRRAWTLIELLVVLAIVGILTALVTSAIQKARAAAMRLQCGNNLRQIGLALVQYHNSQGALPPGVRGVQDSYPFLSWSARILPYLEQDARWMQAVADYQKDPRFWSPPTQHAGVSQELSVFVCPADGRGQAWLEPEKGHVGLLHYLGVTGRSWNDGLLYYDSKIAWRNISDGMSNTLLVGERPPSPEGRFGWWYAGGGQQYDGDADLVLSVSAFRYTYRYPTCPEGPYTYHAGAHGDVCDTFHFWSKHSGGANFLFADSSVRFLTYGAAPILPALASRAGGENVSAP